jgi:hypothetical protein
VEFVVTVVSVIMLARGRLLVSGVRILPVVVLRVVVVLVSVVVVLVVVARRGDERGVDELHAARRAAVGLLAHDLGVHRAHVRHRGRDRDELHAALRTALRLRAHDLGMHGADVDDVAFGRADVHLRDEGERLVRRRLCVRLEPFPLRRPLRVHAQHRELVSERRRRRLRGHVDRGERVGALRRSMLERCRSRLFEQHVHDNALRRRDDYRVDELVALDPAAVAAHELHACARQRDVEDPRVGCVRQVKTDDLAPLDRE